MIPRWAVIDEARRWLGTRWQHQASVKGVAADCIGLIAGVARAVGVQEADTFFATPELRTYGRQPDPEMLRKWAALLLHPIPVISAQEADILCFRFDKDPMHFGIISNMEPMRIIHAYAQARRVVENGIDAGWRDRIVSAYALPGVG